MRYEIPTLMSHEMRTPLTVILATTQLLQRRPIHAQYERTPESGPIFQKRITKSLETIEQQAQQLSRLLTELLDAARLRSDMFHLTPSSTDLVKLVREIITQQELLTARRIKLVNALETIVKRHGGRIWTESQLGIGSTFFVSLPLEMSTLEFSPVATTEKAEVRRRR